MKSIVDMFSYGSLFVKVALLATPLLAVDCGVTFEVVDDAGLPVPFVVAEIVERTTNRKTVPRVSLRGTRQFARVRCGHYEYGLTVLPETNPAGSIQSSGKIEVDSDNLLVYTVYREMVIRSLDGTRLYVSSGLSSRRTLNGTLLGLSPGDAPPRVQFLDLSGRLVAEVVTDDTGKYFTNRALPGRFAVLIYSGFRLLHASVATSTQNVVTELDIQL